MLQFLSLADGCLCSFSLFSWVIGSTTCFPAHHLVRIILMIISIALWSLRLWCHPHHHQVIKYAICRLLVVLSNWSPWSTTGCHHLSSYLSSSKLPHHHHLHNMAECGLRSGLVIGSPNLQLVMFRPRMIASKKHSSVSCLLGLGTEMSLIGARTFWTFPFSWNLCVD